jgi:hypothetical protein
MMGQPDSPISVVVAVRQDGSDAERLDSLTRQLASAIRTDAGIDAKLATSSIPPPESARAVEVGLLGEIALSLIPTAIPALVEICRAWIDSGKNRRILFKGGDVSIEFDPKATSEHQLLALTRLATSLQRKS